MNTKRKKYFVKIYTKKGLVVIPDFKGTKSAEKFKRDLEKKGCTDKIEIETVVIL
jgi:hypothetical protein